MKRLVSRIALVAVTALLVPWPAAAETRAYPYDAPDGNRYYTFARGGEQGVTNHALQIWKESNNAPAICRGVPQGLPVGHVTEPAGETELQTAAFWCDPDGSGPAANKKYAADTQVTP